MEESSSTLVLKGKLSNLILVNIFGVIFGVLILYFIGRIPRYGFNFFIVGSLFIVAWMVGDALIWRRRGVHELWISSNEIKVYRGISRKEQIILPDQITDIHLYRRGYRKSLNILLGQKVQKIPGIITLYPGKRIHLTSDAFDEKDFNEAMIALEQFQNTHIGDKMKRDSY